MIQVSQEVCSSRSPAHGLCLCLCRCGYSGLPPPAQTGHQESQLWGLQNYREISWNMRQRQRGHSALSKKSPDSNVTPQRCLPLNPLVLREQAQGCWDSMFLFSSLCKSTGKTAGPTSLFCCCSFLSSFLFVSLLVSVSKDSLSNYQQNKKGMNYLFPCSSFLFFFCWDFFLDLQTRRDKFHKNQD